MKTRRVLLLFLLSFLLSSAGLSAQEPALSERILFPILSRPFAGNLGSLWQTEVSMLIDTDEDVTLFPLVDCVLCEESLPRRQGFTPPLFFQQPGHHPGSILHVDHSTSHDLHFSLRVRDASRTDEGAGTEIPVVREDDLFTERLHLLSVPLEPGFRQTLRIYDVGARPGAAVRVRIYPHSGTAAAFSRTIAFSFSPAHNPNFVKPVTPGYIQLDLHAAAELSGLERVRVEIEPATTDLEFWAFITLTNNASQQVTVISPQ